jgi:ketosteroid isomerase-like protein
VGDIEIVQQAYEAWFRGDEGGMMALVHPEIVVTQIPEQVDTRPYHGYDGLRAVMADWVGSWDDYSIEMRGGIPMDADTWFVWHLRDGKLIRWQMFSTEHQALEAAGEPYP